ncbi:uncharacterized protein LOC100375064 [Saccoglossus kowalevskii]
MNECDKETDNNCHKQHGECVNTDGSYLCICIKGYTGDGFNCFDINECELPDDHDNADNCDTNADCINTMGNFTCECHTGYQLNGTTCDDDNECDANDTCLDINEAICVNLPGTYSCGCDNGYRGDGINYCDDIDECRETPDICHIDAICNNTAGSYYCECKNGFHVNGTECQDDDECAGTLHGCAVNATCKNTHGSYGCQCLQGFTGDGKDCTDIDECAQNLDECAEEANCLNTIGSVDCHCFKGYEGNGTVCIDVDECLQGANNTCVHVHATCDNLPGTYTCGCKTGYEGNGMTHCKDTNECDEGLYTCHADAICVNTEGSYECHCNEGFYKNGTQCEDTNECEQGHSCNTPTELCINIRGSYECTCNIFKGYDVRNGECVPISCENNNCASNATCTPDGKKYICSCIDGFIDESPDLIGSPGRVCTEQCDDSLCHKGMCIGTVNNFTCICGDQYKGEFCETKREDGVPDDAALTALQIVGTAVGTTAGVISIALVIFCVQYCRMKRKKSLKEVNYLTSPWKETGNDDDVSNDWYWHDGYESYDSDSVISSDKDFDQGRSDRLLTALTMVPYERYMDGRGTSETSYSTQQSGGFLRPYVVDGTELSRDPMSLSHVTSMPPLPSAGNYRIPRAHVKKPTH